MDLLHYLFLDKLPFHSLMNVARSKNVTQSRLYGNTCRIQPNMLLNWFVGTPSGEICSADQVLPFALPFEELSWTDAMRNLKRKDNMIVSDGASICLREIERFLRSILKCLGFWRQGPSGEDLREASYYV